MIPKTTFKNKIKKIKYYYKNGGVKAVLKSLNKYFKKNILNFKAPRSFFKFNYDRIRHISCKRAWPNKYKILYIDPCDIEYKVTPSFTNSLSIYYSYIYSGDWDINRCEEGYGVKKQSRCIKKFKESYFFKSFEKRYKKKQKLGRDTAI